MNGKAEYVEKLSAELVELDRQLDILNFKADNATEELKAVCCQEIESLQQQRRGIELKLQKIGSAGDISWLEMKAGGDDAWEEVRTDLHDAIVNVK